MHNYRFREVTDDDIPIIRDIFNYYILSSTATYYTHALSMDETRDMIFTGNPRFKTFVILENEQVIGYVSLKRYSPREAYDNTAEVAVYFHHDHLGRGAGSIATDFIEDEAKKLGFHTLLGFISADNEKSIRLSESKGYTKCAHFREVGMKFGKVLDVVGYQKILK